MHEGSILINFPAELREIQRLNRLVRRFGELHEVPDRTLYAANLALDELVSNVILHGYDETEGQNISVGLELKEGELHMCLRDEGRAFDPRQAPVPDLTAPLAQRQLGGLGIHLVRSLVDALEYRREGSTNVLTLRKRVR